VFAKPMPLDHHLARHSAADLFLDTLPYNAHTTASDALWAGLPLLTCMGESFASRVAASLLKAVGMPELITHTQEEYEAKAIDLAQDPDQLRLLREKLQGNRLSAPLFNTDKITNHIEQAYADMYERYHADLMPENIYVERCK
jgi:predicted O-linked N-acetylglucosamine transferase (SPINDLY family)